MRSALASAIAACPRFEPYSFTHDPIDPTIWVVHIDHDVRFVDANGKPILVGRVHPNQANIDVRRFIRTHVVIRGG